MLNDRKFNDLYLSECEASVKVNGRILSLDEADLEEAMSFYGKALEHYENYQRPEFTVLHEEQRYRAVLIDSIAGYEFVLRKINPLIYAWQQLGFPPDFLPKLLGVKRREDEVARGGLILIGGKPDSGKSTTSYALLNEVMERMPWVSMTIEDPVETLLPQRYGNGGKVIQREVYSKDFATALQRALRSNVDLILVGEIRDREGAELALSAAHTGHLVITTLHAQNLISAIERFAQVAGDDERTYDLMAQVFRGCIWQSLEKHHGIQNRILRAEALFKGSEGSVEARIRTGHFPQLANDIIRQRNQQTKQSVSMAP